MTSSLDDDLTIASTAAGTNRRRNVYTYTSAACDQCRNRRIKCTIGPSPDICSRCAMSGLACSFPYRARRLSSRPSSRASSPSSISSEYRTALSSPIQSDCEVIGNRLALISSDSFLLCGENYTSMWLDWHNTQILRIIMILPQLTSVDEETCLEFKLNLPPIYQRLLVYTLTHLAGCMQNSKLLEEFLTQIKVWKQMSDVAMLINHQKISDYLRTFLDLASSSWSCDTRKELEILLPLDLEAVGAQASCVLQNRDSRNSLFSSRGSDAQALVDLLHAVLYFCQSKLELRDVLFRALVKLSKESGAYPAYLVLSGVDLHSKEPQESGAFGDIWKEELHGHKVAIKVVRKYVKSDVEKIAKAFSREAVTWAHLSHPNVLPFYGIFHLNPSRTRIGFISPWMDNGTIVQFLNKNPETSRPPLLLDVALGLEYLHEMSVVHGDLKGANILITPSLRACLADFGLTTIENSQLLDWSTATTNASGTARWLAPELLAPELDSSDNKCRTSLASDIYSFACVGYEIFTGCIPFHNIGNNHRAIMQVLQGERPSRPSADICRERDLDDGIWDLVCVCWRQRSSERPDAGQVVKILRSRSPPIPSYPSETGWDMTFLRGIRSDLGNHPPSLHVETSGKRQIPRSIAPSDQQEDVAVVLSTILEEL